MRKKVKIGARVLVRRSNDVIPEILGVTETFGNEVDVEKPEKCPYCQTELEEIGANLVCPNKTCRPRVIAKLANFACKNGFNIEGFSEMTASQLIDELKIEKFSELFKLKYEDLINLEGFQKQKTENLLNSIEKAKDVEFSNFIYALGIENIGKKTASDLADKFDNVDNLLKASYEDFVSIEEFGEIMANGIVEYLSNEDNRNEIAELLSVGVNIHHEQTKGEGVFSGEKVVLTGTLSIKRDDAANIIRSLGGEIVSSVSKNTTLVLAGENAGSKLSKANALGVKVISEEEFFEIINKNGVNQ